MNTKEVLDLMEQRVADLKRLLAFRPAAEEPLNLGSALATLQLTLGEKAGFWLQFDVHSYSGKLSAAWKIWDSNEWHEAPTLQEVVKLCFEKNKPAPHVETVIEEAEALLAPPGLAVV